MELSLKLRLRWGQFPGRHSILEPDPLMGAIAERLIGRRSATAKRNNGSSGQTKWRTGRIEDLKIAIYAN